MRLWSLPMRSPTIEPDFGSSDGAFRSQLALRNDAVRHGAAWTVHYRTTTIINRAMNQKVPSLTFGVFLDHCGTMTILTTSGNVDDWRRLTPKWNCLINCLCLRSVDISMSRPARLDVSFLPLTWQFHIDFLITFYLIPHSSETSYLVFCAWSADNFRWSAKWSWKQKKSEI